MRVRVSDKDPGKSPPGVFELLGSILAPTGEVDRALFAAEGDLENDNYIESAILYAADTTTPLDPPTCVHYSVEWKD